MRSIFIPNDFCTPATDKTSGQDRYGSRENTGARAMLELDRPYNRPSIELTIETEQPTLPREDNDDGQ